ncbi:uncharacterized protein LOC110054371 [Paramuricea clavata]|uniref:Uncharacterized protein LOC110054371, partial n=1 Tax=Paramuricea clavata TaxID=317549 RepID=A0A6S7H8T4_PARCT|nr:uncharacterized protein LOC110054371 [Paramuricea clavata]
MRGKSNAEFTESSQPHYRASYTVGSHAIWIVGICNPVLYSNKYKSGPMWSGQTKENQGYTQKSGLTHAAVVGERKQSLTDAQQLLSYHVVDSLQRLGYETEAEYVKVVNWHNATDGRGITQL